MSHERTTKTRLTYDTVATAYAEKLYNELAQKPYDRAWLRDFAAQAEGPVCDMGCGPGQIGHFLATQGCDPVIGIDLSGEMLSHARRLTPNRTFIQEDMCSLSSIPDHAFGGIAAFYSLVNLDRAQRSQAIHAMVQVLRPGGLLTVAYHVGEEMLHLDEWWGMAVDVDFFFLNPAEIRAEAIAAGLSVLRDEVRDPIPNAEHPSRRAYQLFQHPQ